MLTFLAGRQRRESSVVNVNVKIFLNALILICFSKKSQLLSSISSRKKNDFYCLARDPKKVRGH